MTSSFPSKYAITWRIRSICVTIELNPSTRRESRRFLVDIACIFRIFVKAVINAFTHENIDFMRSIKLSIMIFLGIFFGSGCSGQGNEEAMIDRPPAVAGQFYSSQPDQLRKDLGQLFNKAHSREASNVAAIISPHAGYVFSGQVAASSFNQLDEKKKYENIFILASSHRYAFEGASIYDKGNYETPLGKVKVNLDLAQQLVEEYPFFNNRSDAHLHEHSLEVQLPFLQYKLGNDIQIIPIVLGTQSANTCEKMASVLKPYLNEKNLFGISSDFSHYPEYDDAVLVDHLTADAIISNSPDELLDVLKKNERKNIPGLATSLCGWTSVLTLMYMTQDTEYTYKQIDYMNSGDSKLYGDKERVVGYFSIAVESKTGEDKSAKANITESYSLTKEEKNTLLFIARSTVEEYVSHRRIPEVEPGLLSPSLKEPAGAFVTLKKEGKLRGCIGRFDAVLPLWEIVQRMAIAASTEDSRFNPVEPEEVDELHIEISVLTPMHKISSIDEIELGKHGIYIKQGYSSGTFLPQVATETGWSKEEFLGHCSRDKARIGWDGWKTAEVFIYEAYVFEE
jgi:AmmeMemoRadiSam system protein B/AmmeMemoRadiSam system protein A